MTLLYEAAGPAVYDAAYLIVAGGGGGGTANGGGGLTSNVAHAHRLFAKPCGVKSV